MPIRISLLQRLLPVLLLAAAPASVPAAAPIRVVAFSTVLAEIARQVGGCGVEVAGLVPAGIDPHEYQPTPSDLRRVGDAQLVLTSGKNLENYVSKLQEACGGKARLIKVGDRLPSLKMKPENGGGAPAAQGAAPIDDPHWWHSVGGVKQAVKIIRDELTQLDPGEKEAFEQNAKAYLARLDDLEGWVKRKVAELPRDKRKLVTSHEAFQYFAREYGFKIYPIEGIRTGVEASNRHVTDLIDEIKKQNVRVIFLESTLNPKVSQEITRETGAQPGGVLYADGLGPGGAATYEGMMKHNVATIVDALK
jgi:ABC-type Zn uptake system ZnuABC Zn-binding protein ZnuA